MKTEESLLEARDLAETDPDQALRICNEVLNVEPENAIALFIAGFVMLKAERTGLAYNVFKRAVEFEPDKAQIWNNLGMCVDDYDPPLSIKYYEKALELDPRDAHAMVNQACCYLKSARPDSTIHMCNRALKEAPHFNAARYNRGLAHLFKREWKKGWEGFSYGLGEKNRIKRDYGVPDWDGRAEGTVVVYAEQGTGDEIMFCSCIPDVLKTNKVVIDCEPRLAGLFGRSFDVPAYGTRFLDKTPLVDEQEIHYQIAMGELPRLYRNSEAEFPGTPYLVADPEREIQYKALLDSMPGKKIGVSWTGGMRFTSNHKRTFTPQDYEPFFDDDVSLISLEYKAPEIEGLPITHWDRAVLKGVDFDETAALVSQLDYVITACSTVVYIAGGLGIPCYCLVPHEPMYRYHLKGNFPWYSSVKLVRQGNGEPFKEIVKRVHRMIDNESARHDNLSAVE
jgi:hypothetical protein